MKRDKGNGCSFIGVGRVGMIDGLRDCWTERCGVVGGVWFVYEYRGFLLLKGKGEEFIFAWAAGGRIFVFRIIMMGLK